MKLIGQKKYLLISKFNFDIKYSNVPYYYLKDLNNEKIEGTFYKQQLQKTYFKKDDEYIIEEILKIKDNNIFVKWRGYDSSFNSWIDKNISFNKYWS